MQGAETSDGKLTSTGSRTNENNSNKSNKSNESSNSTPSAPSHAQTHSPLVLLKNDFPYHFESNIQHYVLWKNNITSNTDINTHDNTDTSNTDKSDKSDLGTHTVSTDIGISDADVKWGKERLAEALHPLIVGTCLCGYTMQLYYTCLCAYVSVCLCVYVALLCYCC